MALHQCHQDPAVHQAISKCPYTSSNYHCEYNPVGLHIVHFGISKHLSVVLMFFALLVQTLFCLQTLYLDIGAVAIADSIVQLII